MTTAATGPVLVLGSASPARATLLRNAGVSRAHPAQPGRRGPAHPGCGQPDPGGADPDAGHRQGPGRGRAGPVRRGAGGAEREPGARDRRGLDARLRGRGPGQGPQRRARPAPGGPQCRIGLASCVTGHTVVDVATGRYRGSGPCARRCTSAARIEAELEAYIATGEPLAVAGSCTIDGLGGPFIDGIDGDHTNVIGLVTAHAALPCWPRSACAGPTSGSTPEGWPHVGRTTSAGWRSSRPVSGPGVRVRGAANEEGTDRQPW